MIAFVSVFKKTCFNWLFFFERFTRFHWGESLDSREKDDFYFLLFFFFLIEV